MTLRTNCSTRAFLLLKEKKTEPIFAHFRNSASAEPLQVHGADALLAMLQRMLLRYGDVSFTATACHGKACRISPLLLVEFLLLLCEGMRGIGAEPRVSAYTESGQLCLAVHPLPPPEGVPAFAPAYPLSRPLLRNLERCAALCGGSLVTDREKQDVFFTLKIALLRAERTAVRASFPPMHRKLRGFCALLWQVAALQESDSALHSGHPLA